MDDDEVGRCKASTRFGPRCPSFDAPIGDLEANACPECGRSLGPPGLRERVARYSLARIALAVLVVADLLWLGCHAFLRIAASAFAM